MVSGVRVAIATAAEAASGGLSKKRPRHVPHAVVVPVPVRGSISAYHDPIDHAEPGDCRTRKVEMATLVQSRASIQVVPWVPLSSLMSNRLQGQLLCTG